MKCVIYFTILANFLSIHAQVNDNFSDGDFTNNPTWEGKSIEFEINESEQLQTKNTVAGSSYLVTPHNMANLTNKEWHFWIKMSFSPSASNFSRVYLSAVTNNLSSSPDGYYLQFGEAGSQDAIHLFKQIGGESTEVLAGMAGQIAGNFELGIQVIYDETSTWTLAIDTTGGINYSPVTSKVDSTSIPGTHMGFLCTYTSSNARKFYFDDVYAGDRITDLSPPLLVHIDPVTSKQIRVYFDEPLDQTSAQTSANYEVLTGLTVVAASLDVVDKSLVILTLNKEMVNGGEYILNCNHLMDVQGNEADFQSKDFKFLVTETPVKGDVVITEFMADPTPTVGLEETEFIEVYNRSTKHFNLYGWLLGDNSSDGVIQAGWLAPGEYKILCPMASVSDFEAAIGVSNFKSLNNAGDDVVLKFQTGLLIDKVSYTDSWYGSTLKKEGGYALERIQNNHPCSDKENWSASISIKGGTPGLINSIHSAAVDKVKPFIQEVTILDSKQVEVLFSEGMDSMSLVNAGAFISPVLKMKDKVLAHEYPIKQVTLNFEEPLKGSQHYELNITNIADCWLNITNSMVHIVVPEPILPGDLVINEILFNPETGGSDFIEIYNVSAKLVDLKGLEIGVYSKGVISNIKPVKEHYYLAEDSYAVLSEDTVFIQQYYPVTIPGKFVQNELPALNNDSNTVYIRASNFIVDKVSYKSNWHFELIEDTKGKSLERIDPFVNSDQKDNWHTASESIGFATPGWENSEYAPSVMSGEFNFISPVISPDNDGIEDVLKVTYEFAELGMLGTFSIYDAQGHHICTVFKNELMSTNGTFTWDGLTDKKAKANIGAYVAVFEAFKAENGVVFKKTKPFVVAGKLY
jgi:hypothetical protein